MSIATPIDPELIPATTLVMAAMLQAGRRGVDREELEHIVAEYRAHERMAAVWRLVMAGRIGVSWDPEAREARFHHLPDDEAERQSQILADVLAGKLAPPWPEGYPCRRRLSRNILA
jgi:hypothetical protein